MVRLRRIEPPCVYIERENTFVQVVPVNITSCRIVWVVWFCSRIWWPGVEVNHHFFFCQFFVLTRFWTKSGPCHNHKVCFQVVNLVYHFLWFGIGGFIKTHSIPGTIFSPISPILSNAVQGYFQG